jgi:uncharacterized Zn finger protein (UPF0148 family)
MTEGLNCYACGTPLTRETGILMEGVWWCETHHREADALKNPLDWGRGPKCPECGTYNHPGAIVCRTCGKHVAGLAAGAPGVAARGPGVAAGAQRPRPSASRRHSGAETVAGALYFFGWVGMIGAGAAAVFAIAEGIFLLLSGAIVGGIIGSLLLFACGAGLNLLIAIAEDQHVMRIAAEAGRTTETEKEAVGP